MTSPEDGAAVVAGPGYGLKGGRKRRLGWAAMTTATLLDEARAAPTPSGQRLVPGGRGRWVTSRRRGHWPTIWSLGGPVLTALVLRVWSLGSVGFRGDEAVYAGQAALLANVDGMGRWFIAASRGNSNFLVYQWIVSLVYRGFGVSDIAARLVSVVFSTLTVVLIYLIAERLYGRREAFASAMLAAVSGYGIELGRLALLDSAATFFMTLAVFCILQWYRSDRMAWLISCAIVTGVAIQTKVTCVLIAEAVVVFVIASSSWRRLTGRQVAVVLGVGFCSLAPGLYQVATNKGHLLSFFAASTSRSSGVPWYYYLSTFWSAEGLLISAIVIVGVLRPIFAWQFSDLLPVVWLIVLALFLELYPLKAFNYLLPLIPPLMVLGGRCVVWVVDGAARNLHRVRPTLGAAQARRLCVAVVALLLVGSQASAVEASVTDDSSAGMRAAAYWLKSQGLQRAGALALSHGSGQYVLSFYGGVDAYPFGRFRIATVVPGGQLVQSTPRPGHAVPNDWVSHWPAQLIEQGKISYLVYNTGSLDDPPEQNQVANTLTERQFRSFVERFGGRLVHTVYWRHEARVYIYQVTKRLPRPEVSIRQGARRVRITAKGFVSNSLLTVAYHGRVIAHTDADSMGSAVMSIPVPDPGQSNYHLTVNDTEGNSASVTGLPSTRIVYTLDHGVVRVFGSRYQPGGFVDISYGRRRLGSTVASLEGTFTYSFRLPVHTLSRLRIMAKDDSGRTASAIGLAAPTVAFVRTGNSVQVTGTHYFPETKVAVTYHGIPVGTPRTSPSGDFTMSFLLPPAARSSYRLVASDSIGRSAVVTGLSTR